MLTLNANEGQNPLRFCRRILESGVIFAALSFHVLCSCGYRKNVAAEDRKQINSEKVEVEAYLFDAKLRRHGKPTSFRLEIFQTDSIMALGGRAYLGKGALKGRVMADSLEVYFPSSNEYLYKCLSNLIQSGDCPETPIAISLLHLFKTLPGSLDEMNHVQVTPDYSNPKRPKFRLFLSDCPWRLELTYDRQKTGWRVRRFSFDNGNNITLNARRREYKNRAHVSTNKFHLKVPPDARNINP
jgi:hypothetical protein